MFEDLGLTPEQLKELIALGGLDEQAQGLEQQLAQAQALRQPQGRDFGSWGGNALGGLGDIVRGIAGMTKENQLRPEIAGLQKQQQAGRERFGGLLFGGGSPSQTVTPGPGVGPVPGMDVAPAAPIGPEVPYYVERGGQRRPWDLVRPFNLG